MGLVWLLLTAIIALSSISIFTLSAEGANTDWHRFFIKHKLFVLDVLPLYVTAIMMASPTTLRIVLGNDLAGKPRWWASPSLMVISIVALLFAAWIVVGNQHGVLGFQPVEAGKFAIVVVLGMLSAQWVIRARLLSKPWFGVSLVAVPAVVLFLFLLAGAPAIRSDYSPAIIVFATCILTVCIVGFAIGWRILHERTEDNQAILSLPLAFLPKRSTWPHRRFGFRRSRTPWPVLALLVMAFPLVVVIAVLAFSHLPVTMGLGAERWSWSDHPKDQIEVIKKQLGQGRRLPMERVMSWADLRYGFDDPGNPILARPLELRDLNYQVLRSRTAIAFSSCGVSSELAAGRLLTGDAAAALSGRAAKALGMNYDCEPPSLPVPKCDPVSLIHPIRAHCIPVVQSDFAAAYLISRHGVGAAVLLVIMQALLAVSAIAVFLMLQYRQSDDPVETGANQAMACMALACGILFSMQWILAWSNALGFLPVMGQPMTWLSTATSHHLFMAVPAALVIILAARLVGLEGRALLFREPPPR